MRWASSAKGANLVGQPKFTGGECGGGPASFSATCIMQRNGAVNRGTLFVSF